MKPSIIRQWSNKYRGDFAAAANCSASNRGLSPSQIADATGINSRRSAIKRDGQWSMSDVPTRKSSVAESAQICNHSWTARFNSSSHRSRRRRLANTRYTCLLVVTEPPTKRPNVALKIYVAKVLISTCRAFKHKIWTRLAVYPRSILIRFCVFFIRFHLLLHIWALRFLK